MYILFLAPARPLGLGTPYACGRETKKKRLPYEDKKACVALWIEQGISFRMTKFLNNAVHLAVVVMLLLEVLAGVARTRQVQA